MPSSPSALILLSGGLDSTTLLAQVKASGKYNTIHCLSFYYGSKHNKEELKAATNIANHYHVASHTTLTVPLHTMGFTSSLLDALAPIPDGHYADESMKSTVVPFRNGILLSIAAGLAESKGISDLFYAAHAGDHAIYPDCRPGFFSFMAQAIHHGTYNQVNLQAPFLHATKRQIALTGRTLSVPFHLTYSCYKGLSHHCGTCGTCTERREALYGFDPTSYTNPPIPKETKPC